MIETIFNHRSIRDYKSDPVPEDILTKVLEAGSMASTTGNMQVYSMIVTTSQELREKLLKSHFNQEMVIKAPVHITFCADFNRFNKWCRMRKSEPGYDNFLSFFTGAIDALLASQNVVLEAEAHGLGACYLGTAIYNADQIIEILDIPKDVVPVASIVLGYPASNPGLTGRLPMESVVHLEKYNPFNEEKINRIYQEREASDETKKLLEINQKETLAQIFTDNRYTRENNEHFSRVLLEVIRKQGFSFS